MDKVMCEKLKEEARSLDMMLIVLLLFSIPFTALMYKLHVITAQQAGGMLAGALFAVAFVAMPVIMIHAFAGDCRE
ncbi:MAG: hypothetical protein RXR01_09295 [Thermoproteus sp.]|jgi:hypothetical protein